MKTVFLDANILFAAALSETGGSRALFLLAERKVIKIVGSRYALLEAKRNLQKKNEQALPKFWSLCAELIELSDEEVDLGFETTWQPHIISKDLPILWGAFQLKVDVLVTLDRKDFMNEKIKKQKFPFKIMTPAELIQSL